MNTQQSPNSIGIRLLTLIILLIPFLSAAQGWEYGGEYPGVLPSKVIQTSSGDYVSVGTSIEVQNGIVLSVERFDLEGKRVANNTLNVIANFPTDKLGYTISEVSADRSFLITGPQIGCVKIDNSLDFVWQKTPSELGLSSSEEIIWSTNTNDGNAYLIAQGDNGNNANTTLLKISPNGTFLSSHPYNETFDLYPQSHITTSDNGVIIIGNYEDQSEVGTFLTKTDNAGNKLWTKKYADVDGIRKTLVEDLSGNILFVNEHGGDVVVMKCDPLGEPIWQQTILLNVLQAAGSLNLDIDGNYLLSGNRTEAMSGLPKPSLIKLSVDGEELWVREHQVLNGATIVSSDICADNASISIGQTTDGFNFTNFLLLTDASGSVYQNFIEGNVYLDADGNCNNNGESSLKNWLIKANGNQTFYGITDAEGFYRIPVEAGNYEVTISSPSIFYSPCEASVAVVATADPNTSLVDFAMEPMVDCAYNHVEVSVPFLRHCNDQNYHIDYCNYGTIVNDGVTIEVQLDENLTYNSSTLQLTGQNGSIYTFQSNDPLEIGACRQFQINTTLTCDEQLIGSTVCVQADIVQNDVCLTEYFGGNLVVEGSCDGDTVQFEITNVGLGTAYERGWIVIEDDVAFLPGVIDSIKSDETQTFRFGAQQNSTYAMSVEQGIDFPPALGDPYATDVVEGCVGYPLSPNPYDNYYDDDGEIWTSEECHEIISSLDPNDKKVIPNGITSEHYILANTSLEYQIRFQNTGTDTAFLVVIRDTLSEHLDLATFTPGTSSHPYSYEILGHGYLKFTFEDVLLPDSTTNEAASHGFVKFTIRQQQDLPLETVIENCAAIYFDFNSAVLTNCTWNTIGDLETVGYVTTIPPDLIEFEKEVKVYPNPFTEFVNFEILNDNSYERRTFTLYNSVGQLLFIDTFDNHFYQYYKNDLPAGIYYYNIKENDLQIHSGKLIIR